MIKVDIFALLFQKVDIFAILFQKVDIFQKVEFSQK
jgi:hypothetical protein